MMEKINLKTTVREERGRKVNKGRREGMIPAVIYGEEMESTSLWINNLDFKRLLKKSGESVIIELEIAGKGKHNVLIHEMQTDPVKGNFKHVDFYQVKMNEAIETEVELVFVGESEAVKALGGVLIKNLDKVEIKCLPADLPSHIDVDISAIKTFEDNIHIKDLKVPEKVEILAEPETVVAVVAPPRTEEEIEQLSEKVEEDVTKVEGVVKENAPAEGEESAKKA